VLRRLCQPQHNSDTLEDHTIQGLHDINLRQLLLLLLLATMKVVLLPTVRWRLQPQGIKLPHQHSHAVRLQQQQQQQHTKQVTPLHKTLTASVHNSRQAMLTLCLKYSPTHIILLHQLQQQCPVERTDSSRHATRATATAAAAA
jgi:hypothetical protein